MGRHQLILGDCLEAMAELPACSVDAVVCDPPYGLGFMGKAWDTFTEGGQTLAQTGRGRGTARGGDGSPSPSMCAGYYDRSHRANRAFGVWCQSWAVEAFRILKPGGHLVSFSSTRTAHRMATGIEDAGFDIRDTISWLYWSGFPKSFDVSKAIDRRRHDRAQILEVTRWVASARDASGLTNADLDRVFGFNGMAGHWTSQKSQPSIPTLDQVPALLHALQVKNEDVPAKIGRLLVELNGAKGQPGKAWHDREIVAQGYRVDRRDGPVPIGTGTVDGHYDITAPATDEAKTWEGWGTALKPAQEPAILARKPPEGTVAANVLKWGTGGLNIDGSRMAHGDPAWPGPQEEHGEIRRGGRCGGPVQYSPSAGKPTESVAMSHLGKWPANIYQCAKPARSEREAGCGHLPNPNGIHNIHPTVKPIQIMAWLCRLVTPPGGVVLDPFMGSGTTGIAAIRQGFDFIGIEREARYLEIARARIEEDAPLFNRTRAV